jgi:hypothetical protein
MLICPTCEWTELEITPAMGAPLNAHFKCKKCSWDGYQPKEVGPKTVQLAGKCDKCEQINKKVVIVDSDLSGIRESGPGYPMICGSCGQGFTVPWSTFEK